jgi:glycerophosphoryl diester phosphodiesterase
MPTLNIAHRGGAALRPENTLAAFAHAVALGADGAELDVQLSADGLVLVHHDFRLNPGYAHDSDGNWLNGPTPRIKDLTFAQLQQFDLGTPNSGSDYAYAHPALVPVARARIPTLAEVVASVKAAPGFHLLVELKCDLSDDSADPVALADAALAVVEAANFLDRAIFVGFDWRALARVKQKQPDAEIWCTTDEKIEGTAGLFEIIKGMGGAGWFPHFSSLTDDAAALARSYDFKLAAWTVNDEAEMRRLMEVGVDAICTDKPDVLKILQQT